MRWTKIDRAFKQGKKKRTREELKAQWAGRPGYKMGLAGVVYGNTI